MANVSELWAKIADLEAEKRFDGYPYPKGMFQFPFKLRGQGFFPGGDGLWRDNAELRAITSGNLPVGGVMFVGNDFGTLATYQRLQARSYEDPPTWKNLKTRVIEAGIPNDRCFFTNAILGLRTDVHALAKKDWEAIPNFAKFCREFLLYQIDTLKPVLTVVMGPKAQASFEALGITRSGSILFATHPYPDKMLPDTRKQAIKELRAAWFHPGESL